MKEFVRVFFVTSGRNYHVKLHRAVLERHGIDAFTAINRIFTASGVTQEVMLYELWASNEPPPGIKVWDVVALADHVKPGK